MKKSNPSPRWAYVATKRVPILIEKSSVRRCFAVRDVVSHIIAQLNVKRLIGQIIRGGAKSGQRRNAKFEWTLMNKYKSLKRDRIDLI